MKRYLITPRLISAIKNYPTSLDKISKQVGFNIKNICYFNISIRQDHLQKLNDFLKTNFQLEEIEFDYIKNLGLCAISPNPKQVKQTTDLAEFIGIMLGDGHLVKKQLDISFDSRNKKYIEYVKKLAKKIFNIDLRLKLQKGRNTAHLYYYNKNLKEQLLNLGLKKGNKIKNQLGIPDWVKQNKEYAKACIRGLIDTDGCIYICKREKQKYVKFTNRNKKLLDDFAKIAKDLGYSFANANKENKTLYRKAEVVRFINEIKPCKSIGTMG